MLDLDVHLSSISAGDPDAFARWVAGAERPLRESLRPFCRSVDTEAVLQECLLRLWQVAPRVVADGQGNSLYRLGVRIARNLALDEARRLRAAPLDEATLPDPAAPAPPDPHLRALILECKDRLPKQPLAVLEARIGSGGADPDDDLAARLGMRKNTFLQNLSRARKLLAECLGKRGVDLEGARP
jgi:RNA polymerase sigma-70 factor (ECF subfamily)